MKNKFLSPIVSYTLLALTLVTSLSQAVEKSTDSDYLKRVIQETSCSPYCEVIKKVESQLPNKYIRISIDSPKQLTPEMQNVLKDYGFDPSEEGFDILIGIVNDHNAYAMGLIKERGDDFGYTHGTIIEIGRRFNRAYHMKFKYTTDLFSKPIDGEEIELKGGKHAIRQNITNENIVRLVMDNYELGKKLYYMAELGWHQLKHNPDNSNFLVASSQQLRFHQLLNSIKPGVNMIPHHEYNGKEDQGGLWAGIFLGAEQMFVSKSSKVRLTFREEVGTQYSGATDYYYDQAEGRVALTYQRNPHKLAFEIGAGMKFKKHKTGVERTTFVDLGIGRAKNWRVGIRAEYYAGELNNDSGYNLINPELDILDPTARIYYQYFY